MLLINNSIIQNKEQNDLVISLDLSKPYKILNLVLLCTKISLGFINHEEYEHML